MPQLGILCLEFEHPLILASEPCPQAPVLLLECGTPTLLLAECGAQGGGCAVVRGGGIHRPVILDSATDIVNPPISSILTSYPRPTAPIAKIVPRGSEPSWTDRSVPHSARSTGRSSRCHATGAGARWDYYEDPR